MIRERFELPAVGCLLNKLASSGKKKLLFDWNPMLYQLS